MKNIQVIPTDKPSRLHLWTDENSSTLELCELEYSHTRNTQNIYITSDEEIKRYGEYYLNIDTNEVKTSFENMGEYSSNEKKIILTTDQDLIKDGVQAIGDGFLEWFVKNPNCESVEVEHTYISFELNKPTSKYYKIIIPKEEPKQETIREVVKRYYEDNIDESNIPREHYEWEIQDLMIGFAYQWEREQDKNKYSEEEVKDMLFEALNKKQEQCCITITKDSIVREVLKQFKNN